MCMFFTTMLFGLSTTEQEYVDNRIEIYELEWDTFLDDQHKQKVIKSHYMGNFFDLGWTAAAVTFLESRGVKDRANANVVNNELASLDCGTMGSNTYYYLKYKGVENPTIYQQVDACYDLNHNPYKSFLHFLNVVTDAMDNRSIQKLKGSPRYWHYVWNYYNTGSSTRLKGKYYLNMIAAIKMLKKKIILSRDISQIKFNSNDSRYIMPLISEWKRIR